MRSFGGWASCPAKKGRAHVALLCVLLAGPAGAANHPFGSHPTTYAPGSILPSHVSQTVLDQAVRDFYNSWKARYLEQTCGAGRYVVKANVAAGNLTVSEAHGYGMIAAALMAGFDPDARAIFDGMYTYFREHPTATHSYLMSWNQRRSCADVQGNDSASDGDLDIAYALLLADKQWGSCGPISYFTEATNVLADVLDGDADASARYVLLGDWVNSGDAQYYPSTRTSDFMVDHYRSFAALTADATWTGLADRTYQIVAAVQAGFGPATGLLPDFVVNPLTSPQPAPADFLEGPNDGAYDYNACRDPWRIATDFLISGEARAHTAVQKINTWVQAAASGDPANIKSGYQLDGSVSAGADYLSMAFVAPLGVSAMVDAANQSWLNAVWDRVVATPIDAEAYYENTLKLLGMLVMSGNWWAPESVSGGCTTTGNAVCSNGGYMSDVKIVIGRSNGGPGKQRLKIKGNLFFPQGVPVPDLTGGAQILVEDAGAGYAGVFDLSAATNPVPAQADGVCDAHDAWKVTSSATQYKNRSGAMDPPACTAGSARGLRKLKYRSGGGYDLRFLARAARTTVAPIVGPLRATLVLRKDAAAGSSGLCAVSSNVPCTVGTSSSRCR